MIRLTSKIHRIMETFFVGNAAMLQISAHPPVRARSNVHHQLALFRKTKVMLSLNRCVCTHNINTPSVPRCSSLLTWIGILSTWEHCLASGLELSDWLQNKVTAIYFVQAKLAENFLKSLTTASHSVEVLFRLWKRESKLLRGNLCRFMTLTTHPHQRVVNAQDSPTS